MPRELLFDTAAGLFVIREFALPALDSDAVRVRIELAAPKHGTESHLWSGDVNRGRRWDPELRLFLDPLPEQPAERPPALPVGNMAVGTVEEIGGNVTTLRRGDRVYGYMPVRDIHQMPATMLRPLPAPLRRVGRVHRSGARGRRCRARWQRATGRSRGRLRPGRHRPARRPGRPCLR